MLQREKEELEGMVNKLEEENKLITKKQEMIEKDVKEEHKEAMVEFAKERELLNART